MKATWLKLLIMVLMTLFVSSCSTLSTTGGLPSAVKITGTWQGKLVVTPETELKIRFVISQDADGSYAVTLHSSDQDTIKDVKANSVTYDLGNLKIDVSDLRGAYEGVLIEGKIEGKWMQEGISVPLNLTPYEKPVLSKEDKEKLLGPWNGPLEIPGISLTIVFRFQMTEAGEFVCYLNLPEQGGFGIPVSDIEMEDSAVAIKVPRIKAEFKGKMSGDEIVGKFKLGSQPMPLTLKKGEYVPPPRNLDVSEEIMKRLKGEWAGKLSFVEGIPLPIVIRFEETREGKPRAFLDSPNEKMKGVVLSDVELKEDILTVKTTWSRYTGTLKDNTIEGHYIIGNMQYELNLTKGGKIEIIEPRVDISGDMMNKLSGSWKGKLGNAEVLITFKTNDDGKNEVLVVYPGTSSSPFLKISIADGALSLKSTSYEITGDLKEDKIEGVLRALGSTTPVTFSREK